MNLRRPSLCLALLSALFSIHSAQAADQYVSATLEPPWVQREFRGVWIATVNNMDWPSKPGLPVKQQQDELLAMLDRAVRLNLNAVFLQVRPACDAIYPSKLEPWSYYLTGVMGQAPQPFYDPLKFAIDEAHKRGLELHAWFNPYRAALLAHKPVFSQNHIYRTHPEMIVKYGGFLWLDPGDRKVQDYSLRVVMDVVKRYDIDGVHFDDYFYPYREQDAQKKDIDFADYGSWKKYGAGGGLSRDDWRRENVNTFVRRVYESIKAAKPWVKFGIAPFGIWQPGYPQQITGMNSYDKIYCDSRKWLLNGWLDYCAPQLYWAINPPEHSFPALLKWWSEQNPKHRNLWPGLYSERVGKEWKADEIVNQIKLTRLAGGNGAGTIQYSVRCLMQDRAGLATALANGVYDQPALVPPSPWLEKKFPDRPKLKVEDNGEIKWKPAGFEKISRWLLQTRTDNHWHTVILGGDTESQMLKGSPDVIALTAIDACGVASPAVVLHRAPDISNK